MFVDGLDSKFFNALFMQLEEMSTVLAILFALMFMCFRYVQFAAWFKFVLDILFGLLPVQIIFLLIICNV